MSHIVLKNKFRGCLMGALIGDCIGRIFEYEPIVAGRVKQYIDRTERKEEQNLQITDDTQMTQELAKSLIHCRGINDRDLAERFTERYYMDGQEAGYGANVVDVFKKLKTTNYAEPLLPAKEQFGGTGSFGNGASMRVAPVSLFAYPSLDLTCELANKSAEVTHYHVLGRHGAIFQALAIQKLLSEEFHDALNFVGRFESDLKRFNIHSDYLNALEIIKEFLEQDEPPKIPEVVRKLGNGVAARRSVPTALFCFLRSSDKDFRSIIEYAVSLGGDTDTIGSMAGALGGAHFGLAAINPNTLECCPDWEMTLQLADDLYDIVANRPPY